MKDIPAFPKTANEKIMHDHSQSGMTLRDYFAAKAMQGIIGGITRFREEENMKEIIVNRPNDISELAYLYADKMLKAREEIK